MEPNVLWLNGVETRLIHVSDKDGLAFALAHFILTSYPGGINYN